MQNFKQRALLDIRGLMLYIPTALHVYELHLHDVMLLQYYSIIDHLYSVNIM